MCFTSGQVGESVRNTTTWAHPDEELCNCSGGWFLSPMDTWHRCPFHGADVPHPEDICEWEDDETLAEECTCGGCETCEGLQSAELNWRTL